MSGTPKIEDRLLQELSNVGLDAGDLIDVVVRFELPGPAASSEARLPVKDQRATLARAMSARIESALTNASSAAGETPAHVSVFPTMGSVLVQASRPFVKKLLEQADVRGAVLNADRSGPTKK